MRKVLVTGADGFIGSHLVEKLLIKGYSVKAFCQYNSMGTWGWLESMDEDAMKGVEIVLGDVRDFTCVNNAVKDVDVVYHLAALIGIPYSYYAPQSYIETNITGTLNILQSARNAEIERVVHTSTSEVYGTAQYVPINEEHPQVGQSPYAASKIGADQMALSFWRSFETPVTILRPFNTYGPRQSMRAVIPTIITQLKRGQEEIKLGSLTPTRDFNYVDDTCEAFISVGQCREAVGKVLNAASSYEISIGETADLIAEVMGVSIKIKTDENRVRPQESEVNRLFGDNTMIKELTNWAPKYSGRKGFREGLVKTIEWFSNEENLKKYKSEVYNV